MQARAVRFLGGTAILAFIASAAPAQTGTATGVAATPIAAADEAAGGGEEIVVLGFGQARQVQSVTDLDIARLTPGSSPLKAIEKLPGVNFQAADAFGAYEWAVRVTLRGFNQNQLGFTLDGVPLGDMSYGNFNGLHISRAIISENIGSATVAQGAGALGEASTSNLGGTIQFASRAPSDAFGVAASGTYGSSDTVRAFARVDSGDLTGNGLKGYLSYAFLKTDKWKGDGQQRQHQVNVKLVQDLGIGSLTGFFNFSDRKEQDYQDLSLDMIRRLGYRNDNIADNFPLAVQIAQVLQNQATRAGSPTAPLPYPSAGLAYPAPYQTADDVYFDAAGLRRDYLTGATADLKLTDTLGLLLTGYYHDNRGQGLWYTPYQPTPGGAPLSIRTTEYGIHRGGALGHVSYELGDNHLEVGGWYEKNNFRNARRFYGLDNQDTPSRGIEFQKDPFLTQFDVKFKSDTLMYYVSDRLTMGDMVLSGGWKGLKVINKADPLVAGGLASGRIESRDWFLPQIGAIYHLGQAELFATFTQNMRAFGAAAVGLSPFATTQAGFDAIRGELKPEKSDTYELGGRFRSGGFQGSLAAYYVDFTDRLLALSNGAGIVGNPVTLQNVGDVRNYGFEATGLYKFMPAVSLFVSYSYNNSKYRDNVVGAQGAIVTATKDKTVVDSPRHMLKGEIVYDDNRITARIGADYMSRRYFSYVDDASVPGRVLVDASIGYRFADGMLKGFAIEGSATNLFDKKYVSTIGTNGFVASGDSQTLMAGAPQQFFVTIKYGF